MVMVESYLPDIIEGCVKRVDDYFFNRATEPFHVYFDKGLLMQVRRSVFANNKFPLVWLVYKFHEDFGPRLLAHSEASFQIFITMPTETGYTQQQREDINFKPVLIPIYKRLIKEMKEDPWFVVVGENGITHARDFLPYWGMADVGGADVDNLFKDKYIDAITMYVSGLKIKMERCVK